MVLVTGLAKGTAMERSKYMGEPVLWEPTGNPLAPYRATVDGVDLEIHVGDYPEGPALTLFIGGVETDRFTAWPSKWRKPGQVDNPRVSGPSVDQSEYADLALSWQRTEDPEIPYRTEVDGITLTLMLGDFPAEYLYTLLADDHRVSQFDVLPKEWHIPGSTGN
jgi:hypothetical protein